MLSVINHYLAVENILKNNFSVESQQRSALLNSLSVFGFQSIDLVFVFSPNICMFIKVPVVQDATGQLMAQTGFY